MVIDSIIKTKNDRLSEHQYMNDFFEPSLLDFSGFESDAEFIPLTTAEEEENVNNKPSRSIFLYFRYETMYFFLVW